MKPIFEQIKLTKNKTNVFDLSHERKLSLKMGTLYPVFLEEVVPGDKFRVNTEFLIRMAPMVAPAMHRINAFVHYFFVPNRLTFSGWEDFITGGRLGDDATAFPKMEITQTNKAFFQNKTLADYLGYPSSDAIGTAPGSNFVNALPFRAYQMIYNEYYRDQNLTAPVDFVIGSTMGTSTQSDNILTLRKRAWEKDYFTSSLPWAQRGTAISVPGSPVYKSVSDAVHPTAPTAGQGYIVGTPIVGNTAKVSSPQGNVRIENLDSVGFTINDLRRSSRLQEWLERNARAGGRYIEQILAHFGVKSSDARLQRPEYLGGTKAPVVISEVLQTADTTNNPTARMAGHGISAATANGFVNSFEEHGFIIGIMSILPRTSYQQGLPRLFSKFDKFDYYFPEFANLGEQEVKSKELFFNHYDAAATNDGTFGYQSRYAEYKFGRDSVHGDFKSTLNFWHMGRIFSSRPALNQSFVESDPTNRIFAVTDSTDNIYVQMYHDVRAIRLMPMFGIPGL